MFPGLITGEDLIRIMSDPFPVPKIMVSDNIILSYISRSDISDKFRKLDRDDQKREFISLIRETPGAILDEKDIPMKHRSPEPLDRKITKELYEQVKVSR